MWERGPSPPCVSPAFPSARSKGLRAAASAARGGLPFLCPRPSPSTLALSPASAPAAAFPGHRQRADEHGIFGSGQTVSGMVPPPLAHSAFKRSAGGISPAAWPAAIYHRAGPRAPSAPLRRGDDRRPLFLPGRSASRGANRPSGRWPRPAAPPPGRASAPTKKGAADKSPQRLFARQAGPSTPPPSGGRRGP